MTDPEGKARHLLSLAGRHVDPEAHLRLINFRGGHWRCEHRSTTWQQDLAWAESDPEWQVALMVARLGGDA